MQLNQTVNTQYMKGFSLRSATLSLRLFTASSFPCRYIEAQPFWSLDEQNKLRLPRTIAQLQPALLTACMPRSITILVRRAI